RFKSSYKAMSVAEPRGNVRRADGEKTELRMQLLERAAERCISCIGLRLVNKMARHCALSVATAIRSKLMCYGT
ncbi:hypothetical protein L917_08932, partial [Phytophthora nicotianae]